MNDGRRALKSWSFTVPTRAPLEKKKLDRMHFAKRPCHSLHCNMFSCKRINMRIIAPSQISLTTSISWLYRRSAMVYVYIIAPNV